MTSGEGTGHEADGPNRWEQVVRSGWGQAIRWFAVLGLVLWRWAAGVPSDFTGWLPALIVVLLLLLPDADSVAFGGVKLDMRRTREEVTGLRSQVMNLQVAQASATGGSVHQTFILAAAAVPAETKANEDAGSEPYHRGGP
jgi:hypothetical protein